MGGSALQKSVTTDEGRYRQLFNEMLAGFALHEVVLNDRGEPVDYRFLDVNPAFERLTGLRRDDVIGKTVLEVLPRTEPHWIRTFGNVVLTGSPVHFENYSAELDRHFEVTAFCPAERQFAVTFVDITEKVRLQEEQKRLESRIFQEQKDLLLTTLAGGIAHEFNNRLMAVIGIADILRARHEADGNREEHAMVGEIIRAGERMASLTQQLLAYAKGGKYQPKLLDVNSVMAEAMGLAGRGGAAGIEVRLEPADDIWMVHADHRQIQQMLVNVLSNAFEALERSGGRITCRTSNVTRDTAWECPFHDQHPAGDYLLIQISDTGPGIDSEVRERVFEPFVTTKFLGRGLGLAAAIGIARNHGGCISLISPEHGGTDVEILLPREKSEVPAARLVAVEGKPAGPGGTGKVLLVDDSPLILKIYETVLGHEGFDVITADGGLGALSLFEERGGEIGLVVLDIQMHDLNGREVYKKLKARNAALPVIIASGFEEDTALEGLSLGPTDAFIRKPFVRETLLNMVRTRMGDERGVEGDTDPS